MPFKVGITGGIGSGKSKVCQLIEELGYPVYYSDVESKKIVNAHPKVRQQLIALLGEDVYLNNELNRPFLASKIFNNDFLREKVNQIIHPIVQFEFKKWLETQNNSIVFNEAAIMIEVGTYKELDFIVLVTAPEELKIKRVMERDGVTKEEVVLRMSKQLSDEEKIKYADFVIYNDGASLKEQIEELFKQIKR
ncbi:MAG: dephospho-CoA kinase [Crocinitomicaceae bacterium]|nr:dephospho-CoA kinase [Crocinitomicaceae bacterium]